MNTLHFFFEKKEKTNQNLIEQIILERYHQYYRLAFGYTHHEADACDIVQNGAYKALRSCHTLKNPAVAETWVYRIMLNECFRYLKQPQFLSYESIQEEIGTEIGVTEDSYENIDLQRALDALPAKDKAIVILKFFEDKKLEEIAEILEENINTVKSRLYRSIKKLHSALSADSNQNLCNGNAFPYGKNGGGI